MLLVTELGGEVMFIVVGLVVFWCCDKRFSLYYLVNFLLASITVNIIKNLVHRPRPYTLDSGVGVGEPTEGFSFPSGHTQSAASMATALGIKYGVRRKNLPLTIVMGLWIALVGFSRVYLGQHYFSDVVVGAVIGIGMSYAAYYVLRLVWKREWIIFAAVVPVVLILMLIFHSNYALHRIYFVAGGAAVAIAIGYLLEKRYIRYDGRQELWYMQAVKVAIGGTVALIIKEGLKVLFATWDMNPFAADFVRYFVLGLWVSIGAMASFKYGLGFFRKTVKSRIGGE